MRVDSFDFDLPERLIALHPAEPRDSARLLRVDAHGALKDGIFTDLRDFLQPGDALVLNDTRVIPAELRGTRERAENRAGVSFNLHKRLGPERWAAFARPAKKLRVGDRVIFGPKTDRACAATRLTATVAATAPGGQVELVFDLAGAYLDEAIKALGAMPLPPYIGAKRPVQARDQQDYQTVFARMDGAVAAPTAGLHFSDTLLEDIAEKGITVETVTLHVGAGTFLPVKVEDTADHHMHAEWGEVTPSVVDRLRACKDRGGRIVAVGTTSLRLLESASRGEKGLEPFSGETDIFITPGFKFRTVDVLLTNFHLPRSTLFMLVSAFSGQQVMHAAYAHAIAQQYRFYSYGDACLLHKRSLT